MSAWKMLEDKVNFDQFAREYDYWMSTVNGPTNYLGLLKLLPSQVESAIDVGCGAGQLLVYLADFADHVTGLDISEAMIERARQRLAEQDKVNVEFIVADLEQYAADKPGHAFVVSEYALHNMDLDRALPALRSLVRPGGRLFIRDLVSDSSERWQSAVWQRWRALRDGPMHFRRHGWRAMERILRFRLSRAWVEHVRQDAVLTAPVAQALYQQVFPGASIRLTGREITVFWEAPGLPRTTTSLSTDQPALQTDASPAKLSIPPPPLWTEERFSKRHVETSVVQVFEQQVAQFGERPAVKSDGIALTYAELNVAANRLARIILQRTGPDEEPVAILLSQGLTILVAIFAVLKAGKAYVALDPKLPLERLDEFLVDSQSKLLVTDSIHDVSLATIIRDGCQIIDMDHLDTDASAENLQLQIGPDHLAGIFYTSGSTGEPKGIIRQHRQLLHSTWHNTNAYGIGTHDRHSLLGFCGHTASVPDIYDTLLNGATLCLFDPRHHSLTELAEWLVQEKITLFHPPVQLFRQLMSFLSDAVSMPQVRMVILAGQTVHPQDVVQFRRQFGPDSILLHRLASTEMGSIAHLLIDSQTPIGGSVPVGHAAADKEIMILDETGKPVAAGEVGEIAVRSRYLATGYWHKPELTATKFIAEPNGGDARLYLSGDQGCMTSDGLLEHLGRKDFLVKIRGYRVQLEAVEAALRTLSYVRTAAADVQRSPSGDNRLLGYVVPEPANVPTVSELRRDLNHIIPDYMIPTAWMYLPELPMTAAGKINRRALPALDTARPDLDTPFIAPRTDLEQQIAAIWAKVLDLKEVGIEDDFFELGGDSLMAATLFIEIAHVLPVDLSVESIVTEASTVAQMAEAIDRKQ